MPKLPPGLRPTVSNQKPRRIAVRYLIRRLDNEYWAAAYGVGGNRYPEADFIDASRDKVCEVARERVNKSYSTDP